MAALDRMTLVREYDLTPDLLAVTHVWANGSDEGRDIAVKGAPETVLDLCHIDAPTRAALLARVAAHARDGLRVLGVARGKTTQALPETPRAFALSFLGFVCLADPLRADVPKALRECAQAGIRVVMITGDHPGTGLAIARQAGFDISSGVLTGAEIEALSDEELERRTRSTNVYARAKPANKLRLVQAFAANDEVIAMTGDGVNDAPALKAAHVGVAMGGRGTDVAREAAGLVLVDDDFASLVDAVRLGRRIYANIGHAMQYLIAVHIPIAGLGLIPVLLGWPLLLLPIHIVFLQFVIDPACAFVFEADEAHRDVMRRKPRPPRAPLFAGAAVRRSVVLGALTFALAIATYAIALEMLAAPAARALAFLALTLANLVLIFVSRSATEPFTALLRKPNAVFWGILGATLVALSAAVYWPPLATVFHFEQPPPTAVAVVAAVALCVPLIAGQLLRHAQAASR
jgi:Ca2+-transporting ATPase